MGCRMVYDIRAVFVKNIVDTIGISYGGNEYSQVQLRVFADQLLLNLIGVVLVDIHDNQLLRRVGGNLSAELASDGAAASGHQDHLTA